ncbi:hypothetical protein D3C83_198870 [compost metagenome]
MQALVSRRYIELLTLLGGKLLGALERFAFPRPNNLLEEAGRPAAIELFGHQFGDEP